MAWDREVGSLALVTMWLSNVIITDSISSMDDLDVQYDSDLPLPLYISC